MDRLQGDITWEVLSKVFEKLDAPDLARSRLVNKTWNREVNRVAEKRLCIRFRSVGHLAAYCDTFETSIHPLSFRFQSFNFEAAMHGKSLELTEPEESIRAFQRFVGLSADNVLSVELAIRPNVSASSVVREDMFISSSHPSTSVVFEQLSRLIYRSFPKLRSLGLNIYHHNDVSSWAGEFNVDEIIDTLPGEELPVLHEIKLKLEGKLPLQYEGLINRFTESLLASAVNLSAITVWTLSDYGKILTNFSSISRNVRSMIIKDKLLDADLSVITSNDFANLEVAEIKLGRDVTEDTLKEFLTRYKNSLCKLYLSFPPEDVTSSRPPPSRRPRLHLQPCSKLPPEGIPMRNLELLSLDHYSNGAIEWKNLPKLRKLILRRCTGLSQICSFFNNNNGPQHDLLLNPYPSGQLTRFEVVEFRNGDLPLSEAFPFIDPFQFQYLTTLSISCVPSPPLSIVFERSKLIRNLTILGCPGVNDKSICGIRPSLLETISPMGNLQRDSDEEVVTQMIIQANNAIREESYIGDLKDLQCLTLNGYLSDSAMLYGIVHCHKLKRLTLSSLPRQLTWRTKLIAEFGLKYLVETMIQTIN